MKYQVIFSVCFGLFFCGCQEENPISEETQEWITTEENPQEGSSEHKQNIQGEWRLISSTCPREESNSSEKWAFNKGELTWNSYTHNYHFQHDTLFIAGLAHSVSWRDEVLVLKVLEMNCTKKLKRH